MKRGLDGRAQDKDGEIREKSGATKIKTLIPKYPELNVFSPEATLTGIRRRHGVKSIAEIRELARKKQKER